MAKTRSFLRELGYPVEKPDLGDEAVYGAVWLAGHAERRVAQALKPFGLTPVKLNYLMVVKHIGKEEGLSQREIARRLLIDAGNVTHVLDGLAEKGWILRASGPDRRSNRIKITPKGSKLLDVAWPAHKKVMREVTRGLPEGALQRIVEDLTRWRTVLEA